MPIENHLRWRIERLEKKLHEILLQHFHNERDMKLARILQAELASLRHFVLTPETPAKSLFESIFGRS